jgi:hypothetical protein
LQPLFRHLFQDVDRRQSVQGTAGRGMPMAHAGSAGAQRVNREVPAVTIGILGRPGRLSSWGSQNLTRSPTMVVPLCPHITGELVKAGSRVQFTLQNSGSFGPNGSPEFCNLRSRFHENRWNSDDRFGRMSSGSHLGDCFPL